MSLFYSCACFHHPRAHFPFHTFCYLSIILLPHLASLFCFHSLILFFSSSLSFFLCEQLLCQAVCFLKKIGHPLIKKNVFNVCSFDSRTLILFYFSLYISEHDIYLIFSPYNGQDVFSTSLILMGSLCHL